MTKVINLSDTVTLYVLGDLLFSGLPLVNISITDFSAEYLWVSQ